MKSQDTGASALRAHGTDVTGEGGPSSQWKAFGQEQGYQWGKSDWTHSQRISHKTGVHFKGERATLQGGSQATPWRSPEKRQTTTCRSWREAPRRQRRFCGNPAREASQADPQRRTLYTAMAMLVRTPGQSRDCLARPGHALCVEPDRGALRPFSALFSEFKITLCIYLCFSRRNNGKMNKHRCNGGLLGQGHVHLLRAVL